MTRHDLESLNDWLHEGETRSGFTSLGGEAIGPPAPRSIRVLPTKGTVQLAAYVGSEVYTSAGATTLTGALGWLCYRLGLCGEPESVEEN